MAFSQAYLASGAHMALEAINRKDPIDQISTNKPFTAWLIKNRVEVNFTGGVYREPVYVAHDSNYQNYWGADQVTYNDRNPARLTRFAPYAAHDGFWVTEHDLMANGIILTDDRESVASGAEREQLVDLLKLKHQALKAGFQEEFDVEMHLDGSANTRASPALAHIVSTAPTTGVVGGIDAATAPYWRNNVNLGIAPANLVAEMEETWRACTLYGGQAPTQLFAGSAFIDAYRAQASDTINRQIVVNEKGGTGLDASISGVYFKGIPIQWDPTLDLLDQRLGVQTYPFSKRLYMLNDSYRLRPQKGRWMIGRKPERMVDRYVHYRGLTSDYAVTTNKRNGLAVLSVA